jgi:hypothetical protein
MALQVALPALLWTGVHRATLIALVIAFGATAEALMATLRKAGSRHASEVAHLIID